MQQDIFGEESISANVGVVKIGNGKIQLSKEQQAFNRLTAKIKKLQKQIIDGEERMQRLNSIYQKDVYSKVMELGTLKIKLSHLLHTNRRLVKLTVTQNEKLDDVIFSFLDDAFSVVEPDDATIEIYNSYTDGGTYQEEIKEEEDAMKYEFADMMFHQFGIKIDPDTISEDMNFEELQKDIESQINQKEKDQANAPKEKKKTKKQLEKEVLEAQKEEIKNKSVRTIYLSLAKILHPDTETDEAQKMEKEEMMKKVTVAYNNKDLMELLSLEMQWVNTHTDKLANLDTNTLKVYSELLKDQVRDLEQQSFMASYNPAYKDIRQYMYMPEPMAIKKLKDEEQAYSNTNKKISTNIAALENPQYLKQSIVACIKEYYEEFDDEIDMDDLDFLMQRMFFGKKS